MILFFLFIHIVIMNISSVCMLKYNTKPLPLISFSTRFDPKVKLKMCLLEPDVGPCRGNIRMYYFDPASKSCQTFYWGGCQGNGNRFESRSECDQTCLTAPNEPKKRPRYCELTFDYGFCFGKVDRWYYDRLWKVCKQRIYSGCGGNKNNFYSFEQCDMICRLGKDPIPAKVREREGKGRKVIYVYTNGTTISRITTSKIYTSPKPRYYYDQFTRPRDSGHSGSKTTKCVDDNKVDDRIKSRYVESKTGAHYRKNMEEKV